MPQHHTNAPPTCRPFRATCARYHDPCAPGAGWCADRAPMTVAALGSRLELPGSVWTRPDAGPVSAPDETPSRTCSPVRGAR